MSRSIALVDCVQCMKCRVYVWKELVVDGVCDICREKEPEVQADESPNHSAAETGESE